MNRVPLIKAICRLAAVVGILTGQLLFAGGAAADEDDLEKPSAFAFGVAPGSISVNWEHSGAGMDHFTVTRESPSRIWDPVPAEQRNLFDSGLQPNTAHRYFVCAISPLKKPDRSSSPCGGGGRPEHR